jgi:hypothetical protein
MERQGNQLGILLRRAFGDGYSVRFVKTPDPQVEDDEHQVMLYGVETGWTIQVCAVGRGYEINEWNPREQAMTHHGHATTWTDAGTRLVRAMRAASADEKGGALKAAFKVGARVRLTRDIELYPIGIFPAGLTGVVTDVQPDSPDVIAQVKLDETFPELEEWDNCLQVSRVERSGEGACTTADFEEAY